MWVSTIRFIFAEPLKRQLKWRRANTEKNLKIPEEIEDRIEENIKVCIKPEFEVLHLIYKEKIDDYIGKYKSLKKASEYLNQIDKKYQKTYDYNYDFFDSLTVNEIRNLVKRYSLKRKNTHKKDEGLLENLIK